MNHKRKHFEDTHELLEKHPHFFDSIQSWQDTTARPHQRTIVIAQPRSGSTLLIRLLEMACLSKTVGDKHPSYFEGILKIYQEIKNNNGQYLECLADADRENVFADEYRGYNSRKRELFNFRYTLSSLLFSASFRSGWMKTTLLGFGNDLMKPFVEMLKDVYEDDRLTIVYLTRDHDEIIKSMFTSPEERVRRGAIQGEDKIREFLDAQRGQMRECQELGDVRITYQDLLSDPAKILKRCGAVYQPSPSAIQKVMSKKLR